MKDSSVVQKGCLDTLAFNGLARSKFSFGNGASSS